MSAASPAQGVDELLAPLRDNPARSAVLTDIDGTLAPIVERPEQASVSEEARALLTELSSRFAVVGCISGRRASEARELVGVDGIAYAGNHGLELLLPGEDSPRLDPSLEGRADAAAVYLEGVDGDRLGVAGLRREDKGPIQALHWRGADDERAAEARAQEIAAGAGKAGLEPRWGRKVMELRPAGGGGKEAAVGALIGTGEIDAAIYAGDDRTDIDAFRRLKELCDEGRLRACVCVGVTSEEAPVELADAADLSVEGPAGWLGVLRSLAG
jgi:trehalose 6-phosphate phosphatase